MTRRVLAIAGVVLAVGATVAVAVAIWPDRAAEGDSSSTERAAGGAVQLTDS